jgi:hypothetical protein
MIDFNEEIAKKYDDLREQLAAHGNILVGIKSAIDNDLKHCRQALFGTANGLMNRMTVIETKENTCPAKTAFQTLTGSERSNLLVAWVCAGVAILSSISSIIFGILK